MADKLLGSAPPPLQDKVIDSKTGLLTDAWRNWFGRLPATLEAIPSKLSVVTLASQSSSLPATDFSQGTLLVGLYRATYYARIIQAASTSSSLTIDFKWVEGGVPQTAVGAAIIGNTTSTGQSDSIIISIDAGSPVQYVTTYVSVGGTPMLYNLNLSLEKIQT